MTVRWRLCALSMIVIFLTIGSGASGASNASCADGACGVCCDPFVEGDCREACLEWCPDPQVLICEGEENPMCCGEGGFSLWCP